MSIAIIWKWIVGPVKNIGNKLLASFRKKAEKKYPVYAALRDLGIAAKGDDLDALYNEALYEFENSHYKHTQLIELFKESSAKSSFENDLRNNTQDQFLEDLQTNLNVKDKYLDIRFAGIDLVQEINQFNEIFARKVRDTRKPHDVQVIQLLQSIDKRLPRVSPDTLDLSKQIQEIGKLRDENQHEAVKRLLLNYKRDKWETLSNELKYKITVHLGVTLFELGDKKEAALHFIELLQYHTKPAETYSLAALGYALISDRVKALHYADCALELDIKSENAYLAKLFVQEENITTAKIDEILPKQMQKVAIIAINIAASIEKTGEIEKAYVILSELEQEHQQMDNFRCDILTQLAVNRIRSLTKKEDYFFDQLNDTSILKLNQALNYLNTVWDFFKHTPLNKSRSYILANRGVVYKVLGKKREAERDFLASMEFKKNFLAYGNLFEIYLDNPSDFQKIPEIKTTDLEPEEKQEILIFEGIREILEGRIEAVLPKLLAELPEINRPELLHKYYSIIVDTFLPKEQYEEAEKFALESISRTPDDSLPYLIAWRVYHLQEDVANREHYLSKALSLATEQTANFTLWQLANILLNNHQLKEAAAVLRKAADTEVFSKFTQNLIIAEFRDGNYKEAYALADHLLRKYPNHPFLSDIKASILEATTQFDEAIKFIQQYLNEKPEHVFFRIKLAMNLYKKSDYKAGIAELNKIDQYENISIPHMFLIADAYIRGGEPAKGMEIAYQLRFKHYSDKNIHNNFLHLQTGIQGLEHKDYFPETVVIDCYVALKDNFGKSLEYIIVREARYPMEIGIYEPFVQPMLGKQVSESFTNGNITYTITDIKWKYTHAFHDSMNLIQTRFGNDGPIKILQFNEGDNPIETIKTFINPLKNTKKSGKEIDDLYRLGKSTIGLNAKLLGISPIKYWDKLVQSPDLGVFSNGTPEELARGISLLDTHSPIVLDIVALLTLHNTNGFSLLAHLPQEKYVAQSTIDLIYADLEEIKSRKDIPDLIVNEIDGHLHRTIITIEEKAKIIENLSALLTKIGHSTEIIHPSLPENFAEKTKKDMALGKSFHETILIAKDKSGLLISDDGFFRQFIRIDQGLPGFNTIGIIHYLINKKFLSQEQSDALYQKLIDLNYTFVPMRPELLLKICQKGEYRIDSAFIRACDCMHPLVMEDVMVARFVAIFFRLLFLHMLASPTRDMIVQFVIRKLYTGRDAARVRQLLITFLNEQFALLPNQKADLLHIVSLI